MTVATTQKLKVAIVGLGRMGSIHAMNFAYKVPRAEVVAVCDVREESLQWAKENLPAGVRGYTDVEDMFRTSGAEATLIVTETSRHAPLAELAMSYGLVRARTCWYDSGLNRSTFYLRSLLRLMWKHHVGSSRQQRNTPI
jgi:hypothetical protein